MSAPEAPNLTLYYPFEDKHFADHCFLCGTPTAPAETILVFDAWLLHQYGLAEQSIQLLDQSVQTYRNLQIPCCPTCRSRYVEPLEAQVAAAAAVGRIAELPEKTLFLWLGKMFYGILILELLNELNPLIKPQYPLSENGQMLRRLQAFFQTFQALRVPIVFEDFTPASIFVLQTDPQQDPIAFEYDDDLTTMTFSIKLGSTVLLACFIDNGLLRQAMRRVYQDARRPLHPVQVAEFKARVYYGAHLLNVVPEYFPRPVRPTDDHLVYDTLIDDVTREIFNPWENPAYGQSLQEMWKRWQIPYTAIMRDPSQPLSYLYDAQGLPLTLKEFPGEEGK